MFSFASPTLLEWGEAVTELRLHKKMIGLQRRLKVNHALECFAKEQTETLQVNYLFTRSSGLGLVKRGRLQSQSQ